MWQVLARGWEVHGSHSQWSFCLPGGPDLGQVQPCWDALWTPPPTWVGRLLDLGFGVSLPWLLGTLQLPK